MNVCRILFYGFRHGHVYGLYKRVMASEDAAVAACVEEDATARAAAEAALGAVFSDKSYEEWLSGDIDAVAVGGAYGDRGAAIIRALEAGKHVIADKPICTDLAELERIETLAREKGLQVACMLDLRYLPQTLAAKRVLKSGRLGEVRNVSFNGQHCIDYAHRPTWYFEKGKHGGTINDLAIHGIDLVRMLTGMEFAAIDAARVWNAYAVRHPEFKDAATFMARLSNGAGVLADVSYSAPSQVFSMPTYWEFRIWCERGLLTMCYTDSAITIYEEGSADPIRIEGEEAAENWLSEFLCATKNGDRSVTENVIRSTKTALLIQKAADKEKQG